MNKGFFVIFLVIVAAAMALIFYNQASHPAAGPAGERQIASAENTTQTRPPDVPLRERPEPAMPEQAMPEPTQPEAVKPEPSPPVATRSEPTQPKPAMPEQAMPEPAQPEAVKPEPSPPVATRSEPTQPKPAMPEPAQPARDVPVTTRPETPAPAGQPRKSLTLRNIGLHFRGKGMVLRIEADGPFSYKTFALPTPDRYVVDLAGSWDAMRAPSIPSNMTIKSARVGKQAAGPRLVLDMQRAPRRHSVSWASPAVLEIYIE